MPVMLQHAPRLAHMYKAEPSTIFTVLIKKCWSDALQLPKVHDAFTVCVGTLERLQVDRKALLPTHSYSFARTQ